MVVMKNGDRISGEVEKIWDGEVFIDPEYGDTIAIELEHVAHIITQDVFEIEFRRGRKTETVTGRLIRGEQGEALVWVGDGTRQVPLSEVDNMIEIEEHFDWKFRTDVSGTAASGNTESNNGRLYIMGRIKLGEHRHLAEYSIDGASADGESTKNQTRFYYEDLWTFAHDWFIRGSFTWTRDPIRELNHRSQLYLGPGHHFWDDSTRRLNLSVGPNLLAEDIGQEEEISWSLLAGLRYEQSFFDEDLVLFQQTDYQRVIRGRDNLILNTSTGIRLSLPRDMYVNLQVDFDRESNPAEGQGKDDTTYLIGIGIELD